MKKPKRLFSILIYLVIIILPYWISTFAVGDQGHFVGFILNPIDGNSYLAKMQQGYQGSWLFELPYTLEPNDGVFLFFFYLLLGHLARSLGLRLIIVFHLARLICAVLLMISLEQYLRKIFQGDEKTAWRALLLSSLGSGMGWVVAFAGFMPTDFWVAEAYPFLSSFTNPHFTAGLALLLWVLFLNKRENKASSTLIWLLGVILAVIMPFGIVVALLITAIEAVWIFIQSRRMKLHVLIPLALGGGLLILYQYYVTIKDPVLSIWNAQNITSSPPIWDLALSLFPSILFCIIGLAAVLRNKTLNQYRDVAIWLICGFLLIYFPFSLQRRFLIGFYIPVSIFALLGINSGNLKYRHRPLRLYPLLFGFSIITNILLIFMGIFSVRNLNPRLVISHEELDAMVWINETTEEDARIAASPQMGVFIPAFTGRRVVYGHPFETIHAPEAEQAVVDFYTVSGTASGQESFLEKNGIQYIFFGPRESALGEPAILAGYPIEYQNDLVKIFSFPEGE